MARLLTHSVSTWTNYGIRLSNKLQDAGHIRRVIGFDPRFDDVSPEEMQDYFAKYSPGVLPIRVMGHFVIDRFVKHLQDSQRFDSVVSLQGDIGARVEKEGFIYNFGVDGKIVDVYQEDGSYTIIPRAVVLEHRGEGEVLVFNPVLGKNPRERRHLRGKRKTAVNRFFKGKNFPITYVSVFPQDSFRNSYFMPRLKGSSRLVLTREFENDKSGLVLVCANLQDEIQERARRAYESAH